MTTSAPEQPQIGLNEEVFGAVPPDSSGGGPVFARHDTFHPRFGWLKKGFEAAARDPDVFIRPDAPGVLGVGKNMVRAIRYWCRATGLLDETALPGARVTRSTPSALGVRLLGTPDSEGLDPYLDDLGSLWLLHWGLLRDDGLATAWRFAFFHFARPEFTGDELMADLDAYTRREYPVARVALSSLEKDASCIVRMYGELPGGTRVSEESIHCPFAELGLLRATGRTAEGRRTYAFHVGPKPGLSSELVASACLAFAARVEGAARTVALSSLARGVGSPGLAFRLNESALYAALEDAAIREPALGIADAGGIVQLTFTAPPDELASRLLERHYKRASAHVVAAAGLA